MLKRIFKTSFFSFCSRGFQILTNMTIIFAVSKFLGPSDLGVYAITFFFYYFFSILSSFGLHVYFSKEIAYRRDDHLYKKQVLSEVFTGFIMGLIFALLVIFIVTQFYQKIDLKLLHLVSISGLLLGLENNLSGILLGEERMDVEAVAQFVNFLIVAVFSILFVRKIGIEGIYLLRAGASILNCLLRILYLKTRDYLLKFTFMIHAYKNKEKNYFFASEILYFILRQMDVFVLSFIISKQLLGGYFLALRIYLAFGFFAQIMSFSFTPFISRVYRGKEEQGFEGFHAKALSYFGIGSVFLSIFLVIFRNYITLFFSREYISSSGYFLVFFSLVLFFRLMSYYTGSLLTSTKYQDRRFYVSLYAAILMVILNISLGYFFSVYGIVISRAIVEIFLFSGYWMMTKKVLWDTKRELV